MSYRVPDLSGCTVDNGRLYLEELLGSGSFGKVYRASGVQHGMRVCYAVKCMVTPRRGSSSETNLQNEINLHRRTSPHPNVIELYKTFTQEDYTFVVLALCEDGDLWTRIRERDFRFNDVLLKRVLLGIVDGLEHIHAAGVFHRDLKPENILCSQDGKNVFLADFGLSTRNRVSCSFRVGTLQYMAPECLREEVYVTCYRPELSDLWSLGILMINLVAGVKPWDRAALSSPSYRAFVDNPLSIATLSTIPLSSSFVAILESLLIVDPRARISLQAVRSAIVDLQSFYAPLELPTPRPLGSVAQFNASDETHSEDKVIAIVPILSAIRLGSIPATPKPRDFATRLKEKFKRNGGTAFSEFTNAV